MKKNLILASALTIGLSGLTIGGIANADVTSVNGGSENVDNYNGLVRSEVLDQPSTKDGTALRKITSGAKDGGYWIRGTNSTSVVSKYKHYKKAGRASVINKYGEYRDGKWQRAGIFSNAQVRKTSSGNKAYYDHK